MILQKFYSVHNELIAHLERRLRIRAFGLAIKRGKVYHKPSVIFKFLIALILCSLISIFFNLGSWGALLLIPALNIFEYSIYKEQCKYALPLLEQAAEDVCKFPDI